MPPKAARTRFVVDAMLGSLARKLRALGFDATYFRTGDDSELIELARKEGRYIVTSDRGLAAAAGSRGVDALLLDGRNDSVRVAAIGRRFKDMKKNLVRGEPLCSRCDGELERIGRGEVRGKVPPAVEGRHRLFFRCTLCSQVYWRGSHWKKLRSLAARLESARNASYHRRR